MEFKTIFSAETGGPSDFYRIPSMITTKNGVVVACADARFCSGMDNPNRIDKVVRRSLDSGNTWGEYITAVEEHGTKQLRSSAAIDPVMTYDSEAGRIFLHYCHTPAGVGIRNCRCCVGEDENANRVINGIFKSYVLKDGKLYTKSGATTNYKVLENGDVVKGSSKVGNIYTGGRFKEEHTSTLMMCYSDDDGLTWSKPVSLNSQVKREYMGFIGPGPGNGIVLKHGKYKGRIVVPIYYGTRKFPLRLSCCVIYSDDGGKTWALGETPNNTREINGVRANSLTIKNEDMLTESQLIEQEDGTLKYFMRNHNKIRCVAVAYSKNAGESWDNFTFDENLPQPICQTSVIKIENADKPYVVLLNAADKNERKCATVRLSEDDGETFKYSRVLKKDDFVYSSLTLLPDSNIGALFEPNSKCKEILFTKFSLDWIKGED
jgi:sialidase-1